MLAGILAGSRPSFAYAWEKEDEEWRVREARRRKLEGYGAFSSPPAFAIRCASPLNRRMGTLFRNSAEVSDADRAAIDAILSGLPLKFRTFLDMEWNPEDRSLLDVYTGYIDLPRCGGGEVVSLRKVGDAWQVARVSVWAA